MWQHIEDLEKTQGYHEAEDKMMSLDLSFSAEGAEYGNILRV